MAYPRTVIVVEGLPSVTLNGPCDNFAQYFSSPMSNDWLTRAPGVTHRQLLDVAGAVGVVIDKDVDVTTEVIVLAVLSSEEGSEVDGIERDEEWEHHFAVAMTVNPSFLQSQQRGLP